MAPTDHSITRSGSSFQRTISERPFFLHVKNISSQKISKYVCKSRQMRTYSMSKHFIRICLYSPFYYYDFILMPLFCNCYVRNI